MTLSIYTDGGSKGNPGPASIGIVAKLDKKIIFTHSESIGTATNNVAEYTAVITAYSLLLSKYNSLKISNIVLYSDSKLLVNQLLGTFKIKTPHIRELIEQVKILEMKLVIPITYMWIPREKNHHADSLVNEVV